MLRKSSRSREYTSNAIVARMAHFSVAGVHFLNQEDSMSRRSQRSFSIERVVVILQRKTEETLCISSSFGFLRNSRQRCAPRSPPTMVPLQTSIMTTFGDCE